MIHGCFLAQTCFLGIHPTLLAAGSLYAHALPLFCNSPCAASLAMSDPHSPTAAAANGTPSRVVYRVVLTGGVCVCSYGTFSRTLHVCVCVSTQVLVQGRLPLLPG